MSMHAVRTEKEGAKSGCAQGSRLVCNGTNSPWSKLRATKANRAAALGASRLRRHVQLHDENVPQSLIEVVSQDVPSSEPIFRTPPPVVARPAAPPSRFKYEEFFRSDGRHVGGRLGCSPKAAPVIQVVQTPAGTSPVASASSTLRGERAIFDLQALEDSIRTSSGCAECGSHERRFARCEDGRIRDELQQGLAHKFGLDCEACGAASVWSTSTYVESEGKRGRPQAEVNVAAVAAGQLADVNGESRRPSCQHWESSLS